MKRIIPIAALLLLQSCATANIAANLKGINDLIAAGERNLAVLCQGLPVAGASAQTVACIARANGSTQDAVARTLAAAQAVCAGTTQPPSIATAISQISRAAQSASVAASSGCQ